MSLEASAIARNLEAWPSSSSSEAIRASAAARALSVSARPRRSASVVRSGESKAPISVLGSGRGGAIEQLADALAELPGLERLLDVHAPQREARAEVLLR